MDEPTAALGPAETAQVRDLIRQLKDEGIGIFLVSHDIHDVFDLSDRISVMYHGADRRHGRQGDGHRRRRARHDHPRQEPGRGHREGARARSSSAEGCRRRVRRSSPAYAALQPRERRRQRRIELAIDARARLGRPAASGPGAATGVTRTTAVGRRVDVGEPAGTDARPAARPRRPLPRSSPRSRSRPRARRPGSAASSGLAIPPPDARIWSRWRQPGREHQVEAVAQAEGDALETARTRWRRSCVAGSARRTRRGPAGPGAGCAPRSGTAGTTGRRCRAATSAADSTRSRTRRRAPGRRGTSAGSRPPRASPTSCASDRAPRGRRRGRGPRGSYSGRSVAAKTTPDVPSDSAISPGATTPTPTALAAWSPPPATTGVPARKPGGSGGLGRDRAGDLGPSKVGGSQAAGISSAAQTSADQSRAARSNSSVPAPSALSRACSPVSRSRR